MNLGVAQGKIDALIHSPDVVHIKKLECLQAYYDQGEAKWSDVVKAVESYPINNKRVANNIAKAYGVNSSKDSKEEL